ncbi:LAO/AO transport system ATPase [Nocardioides sp. CF8]|nr:LAO/AO transport system ATPase [Nocardioides sp. CF8]
MGVHTADDGVFVRSVASRGHLGGLSLAVPMMLDALDAAGWSNIIIETVGSGQSETEIAEFSDVRVVLSAPGLGDDVQALKAGLLEIADVLVVNKSDLPFADRTNSQLRRMLKLRDPDRGAPAVVSTVAAEGRGLEDLHEAITAKRAEFRDRSDEERLAARLDGFVTRSVMAEFASRLSSIDRETRDELDLALRSGQLSLDEIVSTLILRSASLPSTISRSDRSPAADA